MKILSHNVNYFLGFNGKLRDYVSKSRRALKAADKEEEKLIDDFVEMMSSKEPDIVFLTEVDQGSMRTSTRGHISEIADKCAYKGLNYSEDVSNKYGPRKLYSKMPILRNMSNAVLYREDLEVERHFIGPGSKQLVYEIREEGKSFFSVHMPLVKHFRKKQIRNLADLLSDREEVIVTGDFNNYYGKAELEPLQNIGLRVYSPGNSLYNTFLPYKELDLFLCSQDIDVESCDTIDLRISDHLPVFLETRSD